MKRTRASAFWTAFGVLVLSLLGISTSLVLANQAAPEAAEDTLVANIDTSSGGRNLYTNAVTTTSPMTIYLPGGFRDFFVPYSYQDDFDNTSSGWPYGSGYFDYGYRTDGDGSKVYHFRQSAERVDDIAFATGPGTVAGDFDYTAWIRLGSLEQPKMWGDEYGLLLSATPIDDPENPKIDQAYTFFIRLKMGSGNTSSWGISKWTKETRGYETVIRVQEEAAKITDSPKVWNIFQVRRSGDDLTFYLTHQNAGTLQYVWTVTDPALPTVLWVGFYGATEGDDFGDYHIEYQFDNIVANSAP